MSQASWQYYDPIKGFQTIGLYHGDESGHVVIYVNNKVLLIDFLVLHDHRYSFYVNEYLISTPG